MKKSEQELAVKEKDQEFNFNDGELKVAAARKSSRISHDIWHRRFTFQTLKEVVLNLPYCIQVSLSHSWRLWS